MEHVNTHITEIVVMYLNDDQVIRSQVPTDFSAYKDIMSCFVCEGQELDPSRVDQISWCQTVRVPRRPLGQKTSSQSQHQ